MVPMKENIDMVHWMNTSQGARWNIYRPWGSGGCSSLRCHRLGLRRTQILLLPTHQKHQEANSVSTRSVRDSSQFARNSPEHFLSSSRKVRKITSTPIGVILFHFIWLLKVHVTGLMFTEQMLHPVTQQRWIMHSDGVWLAWNLQG